MTSNNKGFTLMEILVALTIMAIGFLAMSQMQYLSLRQKTMAEMGTFATNIVESVSDFEMANAKRINSLNARVYLDSQANLLMSNQTDYCDNSPDAVCEQCPCNPLQVFVSDTYDLTINNNNEITCAPVDINNFDPTQVEFFTDLSICRTVPNITPTVYIFRNVNSTFDITTTPNLVNINITYVVKSAKRINSMDISASIDDVSFGSSLTVQNIHFSGHVERDWNNFITLGGGTWNEVFVPHIP